MKTIHPLASEDRVAVAAMRQATLPHKGEVMGPEARPMFDALIATSPAEKGVHNALGTVGGVPGVWCRPTQAMAGVKVLFIHGGGYVLGSADGYKNFASQIAARVGADTFVVDYRRAPEHAFPAAIDDVVTAYEGLVREGAEKILVVGDSAGGGLTLSLLSMLAADERGNDVLKPSAAAVMSPWTDLTLSGASMVTRAEEEPIFSREALQAFADLYLQGHAAVDPKASPLFAALTGLPPIRMDVGDDEVLLDDAIRYAQLAGDAGVDIELAVWEQMPHVFQSGLNGSVSAQQSLDAMGSFLRRAIAPAQ
jgi:acetyl esterase/lipase